MAGFVIHALPLMRGILALVPLPGSGGDYAGDMEHLHDWRPSMVISLTSLAEMVEAGAGELGHSVVALGARWVHVPVAQAGVPDAAGIAIWRKSSPLALSALRGGGRVLIHCGNGTGRSGMAALRLMTEAGEPGSKALTRLQGLRAETALTEAQMRWALQGADMAGG